MVGTIQKWGNSNGLRFPKSIMDALGLSTNDQVELEIVGDNLTIRKAAAKHKTYEQRMTEFYGMPISKIEQIQQEEIDCGAPMGDEVW
jgi:antitoxin MazE